MLLLTHRIGGKGTETKSSVTTTIHWLQNYCHIYYCDQHYILFTASGVSPKYLQPFCVPKSAGCGLSPSRYDTGRRSLSTAATDRRRRATPAEERRRRLSTEVTFLPTVLTYWSQRSLTSGGLDVGTATYPTGPCTVTTIQRVLFNQYRTVIKLC